MARHLLKWLLVVAMSAPMLVAATEAEDSRDRSLAERKAILANLEKAVPGAAIQLRRSGGYATFKGVGSGAKGRRKGVATIRQTMQNVFIRFEEQPAGAGAPLPARDVVFVFETRDDLGKFAMKGTVYGGSATVAGTGQGAPRFTGAVPVAPGVWAYILDGKRLVEDGRVAAAVYRMDNAAN